MVLPAVAWFLVWVFHHPIYLERTTGALGARFRITNLAVEESQSCINLPFAIDTREAHIDQVLGELELQLMALLALTLIFGELFCQSYFLVNIFLAANVAISLIITRLTRLIASKITD